MYPVAQVILLAVLECGASSNTARLAGAGTQGHITT